MSQIRDLRKQIEKRFGGEALPSIDQRVSKITSGITALDIALGGGYPKGRLIEIRGQESSGKTTIALIACAQIQRETGKAVGYIDHEYALDLDYAVALGVDISEEKLILTQPTTAEEGLEIARAMAACEDVGAVVVDSIAAMVPNCVLNGEAGDQKMGVLARLMSQWVPTLLADIAKSQCTVFTINQYRDKIGVLYGDPRTTPGGNAIKYYASQILDVARVGQEKEGDEITANRTRVKIIKNKVAPPFKKAEFNIYYGRGVDNEAEFVDLVMQTGIVEQRGAWVFYEEERIGRKKDIQAWLEANPDKREEIKMKLYGVKETDSE